MDKPAIDTGAPGSQIRRLVAIMFADMTGFTAMMQEDEAKAKVLRNRQQKTLENLIPGHNGTIVQFFGDGTLSIFDSAIDAVKCGIEIQKELQKEPKVKLSIAPGTDIDSIREARFTQSPYKPFVSYTISPE